MKGAIPMAKITHKEIVKINTMCENDWHLDVEYFLYHNEKVLTKNIDLDENHYLRFVLSYNSKNQVALHIKKYYLGEGDTFATSHGLGKNTIIEEMPVKRKFINNLAEYTSILTNEKLLEINEHTPVASGYGIIVPSEDF